MGEQNFEDLTVTKIVDKKNCSSLRKSKSFRIKKVENLKNNSVYIKLDAEPAPKTGNGNKVVIRRKSMIGISAFAKENDTKFKLAAPQPEFSQKKISPFSEFLLSANANADQKTQDCSSINDLVSLEIPLKKKESDFSNPKNVMSLILQDEKVKKAISHPIERDIFMREHIRSQVASHKEFK